MVFPVSVFSCSQIIVNSLNIPALRRSKETTLASSSVLEYLLPELSVWKTGVFRHKKILQNIDAYMLEETRLILKRVHSICSRLVLTDSTRFNIKLQASSSNAVLLITGSFEEKETLTNMINRDSWLTGAFNWLCPNYNALAHSQELTTFSYAYEKDRQQALKQYQHFDQTEQGMRCYLACSIKEGKPSLTWRLESPKTIYILKELKS
jgi:endo-1,4-beta-D-glucanase Y